MSYPCKPSFPPIHQKPNSNITIIAQKPFHANNLILQLEYIIDLDYYHINIYRQNNSENISIFGLFLDLPSAQQKYNSISL